MSPCTPSARLACPRAPPSRTPCILPARREPTRPSPRMSPCTPHSPQTPSACPLYPACAPRTHEPCAPPTPWASRAHAPSPCPRTREPFIPLPAPRPPQPVCGRIARFWDFAPNQKGSFGPDCTVLAPRARAKRRFRAGLHGFGTVSQHQQYQNRSFRPQTADLPHKEVPEPYNSAANLEAGATEGGRYARKGGDGEVGEESAEGSEYTRGGRTQ